MKIKRKRLIADVLVLLASVFVIGFIGFVSGMMYQDSIPIIETSQTCFSSSALDEHNKKFIKMAYEDCADDFSEELELCANSVNPFPNNSCPPVYDCPEIEECDDEECEDCTTQYQKGWRDAVQQSNMYD